MLIKKKDFVPLQLCADQLFFSLQEFGHLFFISHLKSYFFFFHLIFFLKKGKKRKRLIFWSWWNSSVFLHVTSINRKEKKEKEMCCPLLACTGSAWVLQRAGVIVKLTEIVQITGKAFMSSIATEWIMNHESDSCARCQHSETLS